VSQGSNAGIISGLPEPILPQFGGIGGGLRRLIQIVFGLSIAFAATSFLLSFFSFAGGDREEGAGSPDFRIMAGATRRAWP
jgi:hypothetical protein